MRIYGIIAMLLAGPAFAGPFDGTYGLEGWSCGEVGMDGGALAIRDGIFYGVESRCDLTNPVDIRGMNATLYDAECAGEGEVYGYRMMVMKTQEGINIINDGWVTQLRSCP
ncbi:hypothetical protein ALP8811_03197 [Aliiroseovarius pelagivivens]|uniref:Uncharacterized protein n=1 Tax=Aliiroseovarius pelagivivens TaxID=1639690 RepID=A0A2R8AT88_9RHOB|nr:hypothetical protein [Aliiroseovarius pelagivivens]SPF79258.1 hypothetical protein ALP8811_03197 [Aliiroseovarius pelagivivens]